MKTRRTSFAPQLLVADLARSITYYQRLGFTFGEPWDGFYADYVANGASFLKPLAPAAWGTKGFYIEDPDGNVVSFGGRPG